jgi:hypothetical protein
MAKSTCTALDIYNLMKKESDNVSKFRLTTEMVTMMANTLEITKTVFKRMLTTLTPLYSVNIVKKSKKTEYKIKLHSEDNKYIKIKTDFNSKNNKTNNKKISLIVDFKTGYINAQKYCFDNNKSIHDWLNKNNGIEALTYFDDTLPSKLSKIQKGEKIHVTRAAFFVDNNTEYRGIYVNPELFIHICSWVNPIQSIECMKLLQKNKILKFTCYKTKYMTTKERNLFKKVEKESIKHKYEIYSENIIEEYSDSSDDEDIADEVEESSGQKRKRVYKKKTSSEEPLNVKSRETVDSDDTDEDDDNHSETDNENMSANKQVDKQVDKQVKDKDNINKQSNNKKSDIIIIQNDSSSSEDEEEEDTDGEELYSDSDKSDNETYSDDNEDDESKKIKKPKIDFDIESKIKKMTINDDNDEPEDNILKSVDLNKLLESNITKLANKKNIKSSPVEYTENDENTKPKSSESKSSESKKSKSNKKPLFTK